MLTSGSNSKQ